MTGPAKRTSAFWSLRVRTLYLVLLAAITPLLLLGWTARQQRIQARATTVQNLETLLNIAREDSEGHVESTRQLLSAVAEIPYVQALDSKRSSDLFRRLLLAHQDYTNIGAALPSGQVFASGVALPSPVNVGDRTYFRRALTELRFAVGEFQIGRITKRPSINFGQPVYSAGGKVACVVYAALDLERLNRADQWSLPPGGTLTITDNKGVILVRFPNQADWQGRRLPENSLYRTMLKQQRGTVEGVGLDGISRLYAFTRVTPSGGISPAVISIGVPTATLYAPVDRMYNRSLLGMLAAATLALLAAWLGGDWFFLRHVKALASAARRIRDGDLSARTGISGGADELGQLTTSFDDMATSLERLTSRHDVILESAGEGIIGVDVAGRTTFVNLAAARLLGYSPGELIGQSHHAVVHHSRLDGSPYPLEECPVTAACADGTAHRGDDEVLWRKDGTSFPVDYVAAPAREGRILVGAVITFKDITERKRAEEELHRAHEEVLEAEQEKKRFYRDAIRSVTQGKLHLVDEDDIELEGEKVLDSSLESPEDDRAARKLLREVAENAGMEPDRARELVMAAGEASTNAVKHAANGRAEVYRAPDRIIVRVTDHGSGIREEDLPATLLQPGFSTKVSLGMGYTLMLQLADRVWLSTGPEGTTVQVEKWLRPSERPFSPVEAALSRF